MFTYLLYGLLIWFLYNLIFRFIIPVYRATRRVKRQFADMQERMNQQMNPNQHSTASAGAHGGNTTSSERPSGKGSKGDYLDFEEIR